MLLTIGDWILIGILGFIGLFVTIGCICTEEKGGAIASLAITLVVCLSIMFGVNWYNKNTESGKRNYKDFESEVGGGLNREITITAEDGREIFHYEGRVDVETKHDGNANYILFESEEGRRYIIYYGITDTVLIAEKGS